MKWGGIGWVGLDGSTREWDGDGDGDEDGVGMGWG